jgi:hypothetical protein
LRADNCEVHCFDIFGLASLTNVRHAKPLPYCFYEL